MLSVLLNILPPVCNGLLIQSIFPSELEKVEVRHPLTYRIGPDNNPKTFHADDRNIQLAEDLIPILMEHSIERLLLSFDYETSEPIGVSVRYKTANCPPNYGWSDLLKRHLQGSGTAQFLSREIYHNIEDVWIGFTYHGTAMIEIRNIVIELWQKRRA